MEETEDEPFQDKGIPEWKEEHNVTTSEVIKAIKRMGNKKVPGPDGVPGIVVKTASQELSEPLAHIFTECLRQGRFPDQWKEASLVLLRKEEKPERSPSAFRPICLLAELGKLLERIIAQRLVSHMKNNLGFELAKKQYGFREHKSTIDAICSFRNWVEETIRETEGVTMAVSLDIANAFNSIPWRTIALALEGKGVPQYIYCTLRTYFQNRSILFINQEGLEERFMVTRGVPQGSVLGTSRTTQSYARRFQPGVVQWDTLMTH